MFLWTRTQGGADPAPNGEVGADAEELLGQMVQEVSGGGEGTDLQGLSPLGPPPSFGEAE